MQFRSQHVLLTALMMAMISLTCWVNAAVDGQLDTGFDSDGVATVSESGEQYLHSVAQQGDGKLVTVGRHPTAGSNVFRLLRYSTSGSLDTSFGGDGKVEISFGTYANEANAVIPQVVGGETRLVVAGQAYYNNCGALGSGTSGGIIFRLENDGDLDTTFGYDGANVPAATLLNGEAGCNRSPPSLLSDAGQSPFKAVLEQADGKLVVVGRKYDGVSQSILVIRFTSAGILDSNFGTDGVYVYDTADDDEGYSVIQQSSGKLVIAGRIQGSSDSLVMLRLNTDGTLDTGFGSSGVVTTSISNYWFRETESKVALIEQEDGKLVVASPACSGAGACSNITNYVLLRYSSSGTLDTAFDSDGIVTRSSMNAAARSVVQQADGKLIVPGRSSSGSNAFVVERFNTDGSIDTSFGSSGKVTLSTNTSANSYALINQADNNVVLGGVYYNGSNSYDTVLIRFMVDSDGDGFADGEEYQLGAEELNRLDPPRVTMSREYLFAWDDVNYTTSTNARYIGWLGDVFDGSGTISKSTDNAIAPYGTYGCTLIAGVVDCGNGTLSSVDKVRGAGHYGCALLTSDTLKCWYESSVTSNTAPTVTGLTSNSIDDFALHEGTSDGVGCAVDGGTSYACWDNDGTYGASTTTFTYYTTPSPSLTALTSVAVGTNHLCFINAGKVHCRATSSSYSAQLGESEATPDGYVDDPDSSGNEITDAKKIVAGDDFTCVLRGAYQTGSGKVYCWGSGAPTVSGLNDPVGLDALTGRVCVIDNGVTDAENLINSLKCFPDLDSDDDATVDGSDTDDDADGISDTDEATYGTVRVNPDTDGDGASDGVEDADDDAVYDAGSEANPNDSDTDDEGLLDGFEITYTSSNSLLAWDNDSDNDSTTDEDEDFDSDGLANLAEQTNGTYPHDSDSDNDTYNDGCEVSQSKNPLDDTDYPASCP